MLLNPEMSKQQFPSVLLWETSMQELNLILDFMYFGEVKVSEAGLTSFLALAERLQVAIKNILMLPVRPKLWKYLIFAFFPWFKDFLDLIGSFYRIAKWIFSWSSVISSGSVDMMHLKISQFSFFNL